MDQVDGDTKELVTFKPKRHLFIVAPSVNAEKSIEQRTLIQGSIKKLLNDNVDINELYGGLAPRCNGMPQSTSSWAIRRRLWAIFGFHLIAVDDDDTIVFRAKKPLSIDEIHEAFMGAFNTQNNGEPSYTGADNAAFNSRGLGVVGKVFALRKLPGATEIRIAMTMAALAMFFLFLTVVVILN